MREKLAPKVAAADTPSVEGLASGFFRQVCITHPAMASPAPATTAPITRGIRSRQITTKARSSPSPSRARHTSPRDRSDEPALADASIRNAVRTARPSKRNHFFRMER